MTRRLTVAWPDERPFAARERRPIRLLAASDEPDPTLDSEGGRQLLGSVDLVVGCGDLAPDRLAFLADAFGAPLVYVRGNHDRGGAWQAQTVAPEPSDGLVVEPLPGLSALALPWPGRGHDAARRDDLRAWRQALGGCLRAWPHRPCLIFSHAPPAGSGDLPTDPYHLGFGAYRFLMDRLGPPLWLHGHTPLAGRPWHGQGGQGGRTAWVNVTGSVLVELLPPGGRLATIGS